MAYKRLYIIGNGFDIHHGINSSYKEFESWLKKAGRLRDIDEILEYFKCEDLWSSFEENLGSFDYSTFAQDISEDNLPDMASEHADATRSDAMCEVENRLDDFRKIIWGSLPEWLKQLKLPDPKKKVNLDSSEAAFLNFNYTLTLENLYNVSPNAVVHIHGMMGDTDGGLLLGHDGLTIVERDPFANYTVEDPPDPNNQLAIEEAIKAARCQAEKWEKPVAKNIEEHKDFFSSLSTVEEVYAYGFSFSDVDREYISAINSSISKDAIKIASWHSIYDIVKAQRCLGEGVTFIRLEDIMSTGSVNIGRSRETSAIHRGHVIR